MGRVDVENRGHDTPCWISNRSQNGWGYTKINVIGRTLATHRVAYEEYVGPIPVGLDLDHLCRQRECCNPHHLDPVTRRENDLRGDTFAARNAAKTHCPRGHALTDGNLIPSNLKRGSRACLTCHRNRMSDRRVPR